MNLLLTGEEAKLLQPNICFPQSDDPTFTGTRL